MWPGSTKGGISTNPIGLVATIIATAMNVRDIQLLRACDDLFRGMVLTIPAPTIAEAKRPPAITILVQDTKNLPKKAGDEIRVVIQGTPKLQASFDIGEFKKHIDMQEQPNEPGVYLGVYRVVPGDNVRKAGTGIPVAPGPTPVAGIIEKDTAWYAGASPYIIENTVIIKDQATLTIEAGTEVRSRGPALIVEGGLVAPGDGEHVISWDTATPGKSWEGIVIRNVKEKEISLKFNRVQNVATGLTLQSASPLVASCDLSLNATAVRISGAFAKPRLVKNTVLKNKEAAVVITDSAQPVVTENRIQDNLQEGILVDGAAPTISRNSIARNGASGMDVKNSQATITENNIVDNRPYNLAGAMTGESVSALNNWWGTAGGLEILATLKGRIDIRSVLSAPYPEGKATPLPSSVPPWGVPSRPMPISP